MRKTVGLIGCGSIAKISYIPLLSTVFSGYNKLFYDVDQQSSAEFALLLYGKQAELSDLIEASDFIIITTPPHTHYELISKCISSGKKIFCEKPFLLDSALAQELLVKCKSAGSELFIGQIRRFFPANRLARDVFSTGVLGDIQRIDIFEGMRFGWESKSGYHYNNPEGGVLPDTGSHALDSVMYITGLDLKEQVAFEVTRKETIPEIEPSHVFNAEYVITSGAFKCEGSVFLSRRKFLSNKINFYGTKAVMEVPQDLSNAVKISGTGSSFVSGIKHPVKTIDHAFSDQFRHITEHEGNILNANRILNTTRWLETLYKAACRK